MENSLAAKDVTDTSQYAAIFVPGGHGISADGPNNPVLQKLLVRAVMAVDGESNCPSYTGCTSEHRCVTCWPSGRLRPVGQGCE